MFESLQPWLRNNAQNQFGFVLFQFVLCCLVDFCEIVSAERFLNGKMLSITAVKQILTLFVQHSVRQKLALSNF